MTTPREMRERAKMDIIGVLNRMGHDLTMDSTYDEITNAVSISLTGYGRFGSDGLYPTNPEHHDLKLTKVGHLGYIIWRCATSLGFTGSEGLNEISDLLAAAIDERVAKALSEKD